MGEMVHCLRTLRNDINPAFAACIYSLPSKVVHHLHHN
jgi:hypothetical protein